jgi:hypothetical protein
MEAMSGNLFALLTLIVAPAVLTNASSVLGLNTANRFGRVVDRSRQLVEEMEKTVGDAALNAIRVRQVARLRRRAELLIRAQTCFYAALGLFVAAALVSVAGAAMAGGLPFGYRAAAFAGFGVGASAAISLFYGCTLLVRETRLALQSLHEETEVLDARARARAAEGGARP